MTVCIDDRTPNGRTDLPPKEQGKKWSLNFSYQPEYCDVVMNMGLEGATLAQMAAACGVCKETLISWTKKIEEFGLAYKAAKTLSESWWDKKANDNLEYKKVRGEPEPMFRTEIWKAQKQFEFGASEKKVDAGITVNVSDKADSDKVAELVKKMHKESEI